MDGSLNNLKKLKSKIVKLKLGKNCKIIEPVNIYNARLGKKVFIGPFVEIQKNTFIDDYTRISSHTFVCEKVKIGKKCFIGHGVMFVNDLFKKKKIARSSKKLKKTTLGNNVLVGSNSTILPVKISNNIVVGAGSVVTKNLNVKGIYAGNPAKLVKKL